MVPVFLAPDLNPRHQWCNRRVGSLIKGFDGASGASGASAARRADLCASSLLVVAADNRRASLQISGFCGEMSRKGPLVRRHAVWEGGKRLV